MRSVQQMRPADSDVRLAHPPASNNLPLVAVNRFLQHRQQIDGLAVHGQMIDRDAVFDHHFFKVPQARRICRVQARVSITSRGSCRCLSTRATAGFNIVVELSVRHLDLDIIADRLTATEPRKSMSQKL